MAERLLLPPPVPPERAIELWMDLIDTGEALIRAGFEARFGPENVEQHYQEWCRQQINEHDQRIFHLLSELSRRESGHAG